MHVKSANNKCETNAPWQYSREIQVTYYINFHFFSDTSNFLYHFSQLLNSRREIQRHAVVSLFFSSTTTKCHFRRSRSRKIAKLSARTLEIFRGNEERSVSSLCSAGDTKAHVPLACVFSSRDDKKMQEARFLKNGIYQVDKILRYSTRRSFIRKCYSMEIGPGHGSERERKKKRLTNVELENRDGELCTDSAWLSRNLQSIKSDLSRRDSTCPAK